MITAKTFQATIYCGFRKGYSDVLHQFREATDIIQKYVDTHGFCVSVQKTGYVYTDGSEEGITVGVINYPRFPATVKELKHKTVALAKLLQVGLEQNSVTVIFPDETLTFNEGDS